MIIFTSFFLLNLAQSTNCLQRIAMGYCVKGSQFTLFLTLSMK